jgi:hypothetical protein
MQKLPGTEPSSPPTDTFRETLASVVNAMGSLHFLQNTRLYYPSDLSDQEAHKVWFGARAFLTGHAGDTGFEWLHEALHDPVLLFPAFDQVNERSNLLLKLFTWTSVSKLRNAEPEIDSSNSSISDGIGNDFILPEVMLLHDEFVETCVSRCLFPHPENAVGEFGETRAGMLLARYAQLIVRLATAGTGIPSGTDPTSITPLLVRLKSRIEFILSRFPNLLSGDEPESMMWFLTALLVGNFDQFSVHDTKSRIQKLAVLVEELKLRSSMVFPVLTCVEDFFFWSAEHDVARFEEESSRLRNHTTGNGSSTAPNSGQHDLILVTLADAAAIGHVSKKTLEYWKYNDKLPEPHREPRGRSPALWDWMLIRPVLEKLVGMDLPERPQVSRSGTK